MQKPLLLHSDEGGEGRRGISAETFVLFLHFDEGGGGGGGKCRNLCSVTAF